MNTETNGNLVFKKGNKKTHTSMEKSNTAATTLSFQIGKKMEYFPNKYATPIFSPQIWKMVWKLKLCFWEYKTNMGQNHRMDNVEKIC